jgi:uncharacterized NAD(P)/FAD-binding protein YdhS
MSALQISTAGDADHGPKIGIVGFGFSGLATLAQLIGQAQHPFGLRVIAPDFSGRGVAYSTRFQGHLLNVRARQMGLYPNAPEGFLSWLGTQDGQVAVARYGLPSPSAQDFLPRALYGDYLEGVLRESLDTAWQKSIGLRHIAGEACQIEDLPNGQLRVITHDGDQVDVDRLVLATGNPPPIMLPVEGRKPCIIQSIWQTPASILRHALARAQKQERPVVLVGTGLTSVDCVLWMRELGFSGKIIALSRHGHWPAAHLRAPVPAVPFSVPEGPGLAKLALHITHEAHQAIASGQDWQAVVDGLRPVVQKLWQGLSMHDRQRFMRRLWSYWNIHRHRMAPEIAETLAQEHQSRKLQSFAARVEAVVGHEEHASIRLVRRGSRRADSLDAGLVINCMGPDYRAAMKGQGLIGQLVQNGGLVPHTTGMGYALAEDGSMEGRLRGRLFGIGPMLLGEQLETTAVPELRQQAAEIGKRLCST